MKPENRSKSFRERAQSNTIRAPMTMLETTFCFKEVEKQRERNTKKL